MLKDNKKKVLNAVFLMGLIQALIMISFPFANSYLVGQSLDGIESNSYERGFEEQGRAIGSGFSGSVLEMISNFFSIKQVASVSAQSSQGADVGCCVNPNKGVCEVTSADKCEDGYNPGVSCGRVSDCAKGYCYDSNSGSCQSSRKASCPQPGKFLTGDPSECQRKCFVVGSDMYWVTERRGEEIIEDAGVSKQDAFFPEVQSELACKGKLLRDVNGSCVTGSGACDYPVMGKQCDGDFYPNKYCHNLPDSSGVDCNLPDDPSDRTKECRPDMGPGVYYIDSCDNPAGLADACNGFTEECGYNSETQEAECQKITCDGDLNNDGDKNGTVDVPGTNEEKSEAEIGLGESWCVYDSAIGNSTGISRDAPGSTHYKARCTEDGVKINPCDPTGKRGKICTQKFSEDEIGGESTHRLEANCEINRQTQCLKYWSDYSQGIKEEVESQGLSISGDEDQSDMESKKESIENIKENKKSELEDKCTRNTGCNWMDPAVDVRHPDRLVGSKKNNKSSTDFKFPACVGKYPKGDTACGLANRECNAVFAKNGAGRYVCRQNCGCLTGHFVREMNNLCVSLGDCGSYINYEGDFTHNIDVDVDPVKLDAEAKKNGGHSGEGELLLTDDDGESHILFQKGTVESSESGGAMFPKTIDEVGGIFTGVMVPEGSQTRDKGSRMVNFRKNLNEFLPNVSFTGFEEPDDGLTAKGVTDQIENGDVPKSLEKYYGQGFSADRGGFFERMGAVPGILGGAGGIAALASSGQFLINTGASQAFSSPAGMSSFTSIAGQIAGPAIGAAVGTAVGTLVSQWTDREGMGTTFLQFGFGAVGAIYGAAIAGTAGIGGGSSGAVALGLSGGGLIGLGIAVGFIIYTFAADVGDTQEVTVSFECQKWQAPTGVSKETCESCQDGDEPCTPYKCQSLGQNCKTINKNTNNVLCIAEDPDDQTAPVLTRSSTQAGYSMSKPESENNHLYRLKSKSSHFEDDIVPDVIEKKRLWFSMETDEPAQCKYSFVDPAEDYEAMEANYPSGNNNYKEEHNFSVKIPSLQQIRDNLDEEQSDLNSPIETEMYIRCEDNYGSATHEDGVKIKMSVAKSPDETPPVIKGYQPESKKEFEFLPESREITAYVDERDVTCRWNNENVAYKNMSSLAESSSFEGTTCKNRKSPLNDGYACNLSISNFKEGKNEFFVKCRDDSGNIGDSVYRTKVLDDINKTEYIEENGIEITSHSPEDGELISTDERPATVDIKVDTSGGHSGGDATCRYNFGSPESYTSMTPFVETGSSSHALPLEQLGTSGNKSVSVKCEDLDGVSTASERINFTLDIDQTAPFIIENKTDSGKLAIRTDEPAKCVYNSTTCDFEVPQGGKEFNSGSRFSTSHSTSWDPSKPYRIKCTDEFGNDDRCTTFNNQENYGGPQVLMAWEESDKLKVKTDRKAKCYYGFNDCSFDVLGDYNKSMSDSFTKEHSKDWNPSTTHYIKCKDEWNNPNPSCQAIVKPNDF